VSWEHDGRVGSALIAGNQREGFAMLRDRGRKLIAFHASKLRPVYSASEPSSPNLEDFTIAEDDFVPQGVGLGDLKGPPN